jgi:hypothetical protein
MKIYHITEAPKIKVGDRKEPSFDIDGAAPSDGAGKPLKGQSLKLNGVTYQWKGASWVVTDTSDFKGKNPPKMNAMADKNAQTLLNQKAARVNGVPAPKVKVDAPSGNAPKVTAVPSNIDGGGEAELKARLDKIEAAQKKASRGFFKKYIGPIVKWFGIGGIGATIQAALNVPQLEDAFDAYLRSLVNAGMTDPTRCKTIGSIATADGGVPLEVARAYRKVVSLTVELIFEAIVGIFTGLSTRVAYVLAAAIFVKLGIVSGGVTVVLSLIVGGAWLIGGPELIRRCLDAVGFQEKLENLVARNFLSMYQACRWANIIDALQVAGNKGANLAGGGLTKVGIPDFASGAFGESATIVEGKSNSAIKSDLEKIIKSDPEILAAYKKGKKLLPKFKAKLKAD